MLKLWVSFDSVFWTTLRPLLEFPELTEKVGLALCEWQKKSQKLHLYSYAS